MVETPGRAVLQVEAGTVDLDFEERDFADAESDEGERRGGSGEGEGEGELNRGLGINPEDRLRVRVGVHEERVLPPPEPDWFGPRVQDGAPDCSGQAGDDVGRAETAESRKQACSSGRHRGGGKRTVAHNMVEKISS